MLAKWANFAQGIGPQINKVGQPTKCPNLCTYAQESYGKMLGHFVGCPTLLI